MIAKKKPKFTKSRRPAEALQRVLGLRSSNAAGRHVPKHRKGNRGARRRRAIEEGS